MTHKAVAQPFNQKIRLRILQVGGLFIGLGLLVTQPAFFSMGTHEFIEDIGLLLVVLGIAGRLWSTLYIGGRKNSALVTAGPYSMTRNPLYVSSCIAAAGIGMLAGSLVAAVILFVFAYIALGMASGGEERYLATRYDSAFEIYRARTPRFWPRPSLYAEGVPVTFSPRALKRTFMDGIWFLALFPALETIEHLQDIRVLPVWFHIV